MIRRHVVTGLQLLVAFATRVGAQNARCDDATIRSKSVGVVRIGMSMDSVRARCPIVRDTMEDAEGDLHRVVYALVAGDTLTINVERDTVWTMSVDRPRYATADSVRVGMPVARFIAGRRVTTGVGEGEVFVFAENECGNSFRMSGEVYGRIGSNVIVVEGDRLMVRDLSTITAEP